MLKLTTAAASVAKSVERWSRDSEVAGSIPNKKVLELNKDFAESQYYFKHNLICISFSYLHRSQCFLHLKNVWDIKFAISI